MHSTPVFLDQSLNDGESDTRTADMAMTGLPSLVESLEYQFAFIVRNARPFIRDVNVYAGAILFGAQVNRRSRWRELHGIGNQVIEYDFELAAVYLLGEGEAQATRVIGENLGTSASEYLAPG